MVSLSNAAFPLLSAEAEESVVDAGPEWHLPSLSVRDGVVIWGHPPLPFGTPPAVAARAAAAREAALMRIRRNPPHRVAEVRIHRWAPPRFDTRALRSGARRIMYQGALVELRPSDPPASRIEAVAREAGLQIRSFRPTATGAALAAARSKDSHCLLRLARAGGPGDPAAAAEALIALAGLELVPRLLNRGSSQEASWSVESALPGRRPRTMDDGLVTEVADLCARLPVDDDRPRAFDEDLHAIARALPTRDQSIAALRKRWSADVAALPATIRHGDLWLGNLLAIRGRLTGIVDWDHWHPSGVPGTDLLHLLGLDHAGRRRLGLGMVYDYLRGEGFPSLLDDMLRRLGVGVTPQRREAIVGAWWTSAVAGSLTRLPHLALDETWVQRNVDQVLRGAGAD